jgi:flagellar capping protein FliD
MVTQLLENAKKPAYVMLDKQEKLEQKKTYWEELQVAFQNLQSSLSPLKLASTFKAKQVEISRVDRNTSYKGVLNATVNADAAIDVYDLQVLQLAKSQINRSKQLSGTLGNIFGSGSLSNSYFYVNMGGQKVQIEVRSTDTLATLAERINTQMKTRSSPVAMTATVVDGRLILKSDNTGLDRTPQTVEVTRSANAADTLDLNMDLSGNGGTISVKGTVEGVTTTYEAGRDFDVIGNRIRWRTHDPLLPPPDVVYQDIYTAYQGDTYVVTATRSDDGDVDRGVLPFTPLSTGTDISITSHNGTVSYVNGTDFEVGVDGAIHWKGVKRPPDGAEYEVTYVSTAGGETITLDITRDSQDDAFKDASAATFNYAEVAKGTAVISAPGSRIWREGADFEIVQDVNGKAAVQWYTGGGIDAPLPGAAYTLTLQKTDGTTVTATGARSDKDIAVLPNNGKFISPPQGTHAVTYNGTTFTMDLGSGGHFVPALNVTGVPDSTNPGTQLELTWRPQGQWPDSASLTPPYDDSTPSAHAKSPMYGTKYTVEYTSNTSTFYLSDDDNGTLAVLGLDQMDADHYTAAQDAMMLLDGEPVSRSSNHIGEAYKNELIKGMTIELSGEGQVSLDVSQDAETAVTSLQSFLSAYNDILGWIDTRMTEKALDETKKATLDSDDFRMRWGVLNGSSLLRNAKNSMRTLTSQVYTPSFTRRDGRNTLYGTMEQNGVTRAGTFVVSVGGRVATFAVTPEDTLATIAAKINNSKIDGQDNPLYFDPDGQQYPVPFAKASVEEGKLVITAGTDSTVTLRGSSTVLSTLGMNYEYTALSQIGIRLPSEGEMTTEGKSGQLNFDTSVFMAALENNADDVSMLVTNFAGQMQTFMDGMIKASQKEVAAGVTTAQGAVVREINAIDAEIKSIDTYLADFERRLQAKEESLLARFSAAEVSLSKLMQQASWLATVTSQLQASASGTAA